MQHEENTKSERNSKALKSAIRKLYMERAQHEESVTLKNGNLKIVKREKSTR